MMDTGNLCHYLDWDSDFFGLRIARITLNRLNPNAMKTIIEWCNSNKIDCLYFLCDVDDEPTIQLAEENNFHFVDIRITLQYLSISSLVLDKPNTKITIRLSAPDDVPALRAIARVNHIGTRFYFDPSFPTSLCDALYETWIDRSCNGYADAVLVAIIDNQPLGYITCHIVDEDRGKIGLFGVEKEWRGFSIGSDLINESKHLFSLRGINQVEVVTQGSNYSAQRLYQRHGFFMEKVQLWYHRWFTNHTN